jgi:hypothetical protein
MEAEGGAAEGDLAASPGTTAATASWPAGPPQDKSGISSGAEAPAGRTLPPAPVSGAGASAEPGAEATSPLQPRYVQQPQPPAAAFLARSRLSRHTAGWDSGSNSAACTPPAEPLDSLRPSPLPDGGGARATLAARASGGPATLLALATAGAGRSANSSGSAPPHGLARTASLREGPAEGDASSMGGGGGASCSVVPPPLLAPLLLPRCDSPGSMSFSGLEAGAGGPGQLLRLHCVSFNMSSAKPPTPLPPALLGLDPSQQELQLQGEGAGTAGVQGWSEGCGTGAPDLVAVATQVRLGGLGWGPGVVGPVDAEAVHLPGLFRADCHQKWLQLGIACRSPGRAEIKVWRALLSHHTVVGSPTDCPAGVVQPARLGAHGG